MLRAPDRLHTRRDTATFLLCLALSVGALFGPQSWGYSAATVIREWVLWPLLWLQERGEEARTSRTRFSAVVAQRDSAVLAAQTLPGLRAENERLRLLMGLAQRLPANAVPAEVLHQAQLTDGQTLLLSAGRSDGMAVFQPVVGPEGLVGFVRAVGRDVSVAVTWAHPDFRASAFVLDGSASGIVSRAAGTGSEPMLELRGIPYRDSVAVGSLVVSSGLGGVFPKGIPIGTVVGLVRESEGWERVYLLRPAVNPATVSHVLVLRGGVTWPADLPGGEAP